jgi:pimeloyl-ACP methyl ester carboxylesterase
MRVTRRQWLQTISGALASLGSLSSPFAQTQSSSSFEVQDFDWTDGARNRVVPVRLYLPTSPGERKPLVVFSHGLGGSRMGYSYLAKHLAAAGYVCVHPQHAGSDRAIWTSNPLSMFANMSKAAADDNAIARARDISFVIDTLLAGPFAAQIDPARIAMAGHSYGANTSLLIAGATVLRGDGKVYNLRDPRVNCAVILSAPPFHGAGDMKPILGGIAIPTLHITGTEDVIRVPGYGSDLSARISVFEATSCNNAFEKRKYLFVFNGATHSVFTDRIDRVGPIVSAKVKQATSDLALLFLDSNLRPGMTPVVAAANGTPTESGALTSYAREHKDLFSEVRL